MTLPTDSKARKHLPIATGVLDYFPDALAAIAAVSFLGNEKHNPGEPLHWAREKSTDHADCVIRHFLERGTVDDDGDRHSAKMAWRALAILQLEIEAERAMLPSSEELDGWIPWTGGKEPPVDPGTIVDVKFRNPMTPDDDGRALGRPAYVWDWYWYFEGKGDYEIIAYRTAR